MKFEDLKLPHWSAYDTLHEMRDRIARAIWQQMRDHYENKPEQPAQEWRLPDPPPGQQWHRPNWTEDMLVDSEGNQYRPLLLREEEQREDEFLFNGAWREGPLPGGALKTDLHRRTRRPLPVEYVPLGPEDVPPGSVVRTIGADWWKQVAGVRGENLIVAGAGNLSWRALAENGWEILRPNSTTWEPCKKPKA